MLTSLEPFISVQEEVNVKKGKKKIKKEKQDSYSVALTMQYPLLALKYHKRISLKFHIRTKKNKMFIFQKRCTPTIQFQLPRFILL